MDMIWPEARFYSIRFFLGSPLCNKMYIAVIVIVLITAAILAYRAFHATERYSSTYIVQFISSVDDKTGHDVYSAFTATKSKLKNVVVKYIDRGSQIAQDPIKKFGIKTFPDIRVLKDGESITKYEKKTYGVDEVKGWILGKVPDATWK